MSMTEEELRVRYGTQQIESDEDDELLGDSNDDVIIMSSRHDGDHAPSSDLDYQYEQELDYDEVVEMDHERYETENKTQLKEASDEEDEVKVHVTDDIEETEGGDHSSDEEGEIKESGEEDNISQSTLSSVVLYGGQSSPPSATKDSPVSEVKATPGEARQGEEGSPPIVKDKTSSQPSSPSKRESERVASSPKRNDTSKKLSKKQTKRRREVEEGEESGSVDSESDSDSSRDQRESHSRSSTSRSRRERSPRSPVHPPPGDSGGKTRSVCRHFLNGRCSWGNSCRFLHERPPDMRKPPPRERFDMHPRFPGPPVPHLPPGGPPPFGGMPHPMFIPPGHPDFLPPMMGPMGPGPFPPHGPPPPHGRHPHDLPMHPFPPPPFISRGSGPKVSEVHEESEGWLRLRTVTAEWNSDEDEPKPSTDTLKTATKKKKKKQSVDSDDEGEGGVKGHGRQLSSEQWFDPWSRQGTSKTKKKKKKKEEVVDEPPSSDSDSEAKMVAALKAKKRKRSKTKKLKKNADAKRAVIAEENSSLSDSDEEQPPVKKKMKKSAKLASKKHKVVEVSSDDSDQPSESMEDEDDVISSDSGGRGKKRKRKGGEAIPRKSREKLSRTISSDVEMEKVKKKKKAKKAQASPPESPFAAQYDSYDNGYYGMPHPHHVPPHYLDRPGHPFMDADRRGRSYHHPPPPSPYYPPHHPHSPLHPHLPPHHHHQSHSPPPSHAHRRYDPRDDYPHSPPSPPHPPPPPSSSSSSRQIRSRHSPMVDQFGRDLSRRVDHSGTGQSHARRDRTGKGRHTPPSPPEDMVQRRDRGKVARGDDRSYSPPPPDEPSYYNRRQQRVKHVRPGTNEQGEPPYAWTEDRRGVAEARRYHGSSEDGSRSLTPAMTDEEVDEDWLLAEEEEQMMMMERRKGLARSEWSGGGNGRNRSDVGDRERRRYERPGSRESNMYSSSRGNRERFAYQQEINQAVGNRKFKSKKPN